MSAPIGAFGTAIYSKLAGGTALITALGGTAIYDTLAPQGTDLPYLIFQWQGGGDINMTPRRSRNVVYVVKGVAATKAKATQIDAAVDALLHNGTLTMTGWTNYWLAREGDVSYLELEESGNRVWHVGGMYRFRFCE